jgi:transposase
MSEVTTIGLDLAKHVFQVHGVNARGATVLRKQLRRGQVVAFFAALAPARCCAAAPLRAVSGTRSPPADPRRSAAGTDR